jgi:hypothetical protein
MEMKFFQADHSATASVIKVRFLRTPSGRPGGSHCAARPAASAPPTRTPARPQGFEAHLSSKEALRKRMQRSWRAEDRWFSLSSTTSPVVSAAAAPAPAPQAASS